MTNLAWRPEWQSLLANGTVNNPAANNLTGIVYGASSLSIFSILSFRLLPHLILLTYPTSPPPLLTHHTKLTLPTTLTNHTNRRLLLHKNHQRPRLAQHHNLQRLSHRPHTFLSLFHPLSFQFLLVGIEFDFSVGIWEYGWCEDFGCDG